MDTNRGDQYPAEVLLSFKAFQEARVAREQGGVRSPIGWFHEIVIRQSPVFSPGEKLRFGKVTLVEGDNASGKTALCDWIAALNSPSSMWRWNHAVKRESILDLEFTYFNPLQQNARVQILDSGMTKYSMNDREVPYYPLQLGIIRLPQYLLPEHNSSSEDLDEVETIGGVIGCDRTTVVNLVPLVNRFGQGSVRNINLRSVDGKLKLYAHHPNEKFDFSFLRKSGSQKAMILVELCVAMARFSAEFMPTILLLDGGMSSLDANNFTSYLEYLLSSEHHFQTIVMQLPQMSARSNVPWKGWEFAQLTGSERCVTIDQTPF